MIAWWMTQSLVIGAWLAAGAALLDLALRHLGRPVRLAWFGGLLALGGFTAWTIGRPSHAPSGAAEATLVASGVVATDDAPAASAWPTLVALPQDAVRALGAAVMRHEAVRAAEPWLGAGWLGTSALAALALFGLHARLARRRRRWAHAGDVDGVAVRVAEDEGPFVLGVAPPEIVLPAWTASLPAEGRALIVAHEREHVRGGDPWMLAVANAAVVALPWHPVAWWMQARLRLAVELDCDRRCLAAGTDAGTYGRLLIAAADLVQSRLPWRAVAPAFATRRSHLERRLLAMTHVTRRPGRTVALTASIAALVATVAACESTAPTAAQVAAADASTMKATLVPGVADSNVTYVVNGRVVSADEARRVLAEDIETITVAKRSDGTRARIEITDGPRAAAWTKAMVPGASSSDTTALGRALIVIDGVVQTSPAAMNAHSPARIASVVILKGQAARQLYDVATHPNAANGVVRITTKPQP